MTGLRSFDLVAFDLYGTLLDIGGLAARMEPVIGKGAEQLLARWRNEQLAGSRECNRRGSYRPWDRVTADALERVAPGLSERERERLTGLWLTVPAYRDAAGALQALRAAKARIAILSNGTREMIRQALQAGGLAVDCVLSADDVGVYKTDPRVYRLLDAQAPRDRTLFVSSNGWDAEGARRDGRTVAWIDRGGDPPAIAPEFRVTALSEIPGLLPRA